MPKYRVKFEKPTLVGGRAYSKGETAEIEVDEMTFKENFLASGSCRIATAEDNGPKVEGLKPETAAQRKAREKAEKKAAEAATQ